MYSKSRDIPYWSCQAGHLTIADWIVGRGEDNGDDLGGVLRCLYGIGSVSDNDVDLELDQLGNALRESFRPSLRVAELEDNGFSFNVAELTEALLKSLKAPCGIGRQTRIQNTNSRDFPHLLPRG